MLSRRIILFWYMAFNLGDTVRVHLLVSRGYSYAMVELVQFSE